MENQILSLMTRKYRTDLITSAGTNERYLPMNSFEYAPFLKILQCLDDLVEGHAHQRVTPTKLEQDSAEPLRSTV